MEQMNLNDIFSFLDKLQGIIDDRATVIAERTPVDAYESEDTKDIATALAKAQGEFPIIQYNKENPYFKSGYADFDSIVRSIRPALAKNGFSITQQTRIMPDGATILHTRLRHTSGQWIECRARILPPKNDPQSYASTLTYQKRYSFMALLNITVSDDWADDDAESAMVPARDTFAKGVALNTKYNPKEQSTEPVSKEQIDELEYELAEYPDIAEKVLDAHKIQSIADMPKSKYMTSLIRIREIKQLRNTGNK